MVEVKVKLVTTIETYGRDTIMEIDLDVLTNNIQNIRGHSVREKKIMLAVKADAYGHGAVEVSKASIKAGVDYLAVAFIDEAIQLRQAGINVPILILGDTPSHAIKEAIANNLSITVHSLEQLNFIVDIDEQVVSKVTIHIKIDTGMNRLGLQIYELEPALRKLLKCKNIFIEGIYTHFSCADEIDNTYTNMQVEIFKKALNKFENFNIYPPLVHLSNSAASIAKKENIGNMVRVGISVYGMFPLETKKQETPSLKQVLRLKSKVVHIKKVPANTRVGYGATYKTERDTWIATVPIGYADGISRQLSNKGQALVKGKRVPIIGRVCMDQLMLDITTVIPIQEREEVVFFGDQDQEFIHINEIAENTNSINYEVMCLFGHRIPKVYLQNGKVVSVVNNLRKFQDDVR